jgi:hypothetical protein
MKGWVLEEQRQTVALSQRRQPRAKTSPKMEQRDWASGTKRAEEK